MINLITRISVVGIAVITAALVILLSAFNGIESMIERLYSEFDTDLTVRVEKGKSFNESRIDLEKIQAIEGIQNLTRVVEEVVILKHEEKWVNASLLGVDSTFLEITEMKNPRHIISGKPALFEEGEPRGIVGVSLLGKLEAGIHENGLENESLVCYAPKRDAKIRFGKNPFRMQVLELSGSVNYNREVNESAFIVPLETAKDMLGYSNQISAIYIDGKPGEDNETLKARVQEVVGSDFVVKTNFQKNELIYKTSKSERVIVLIILLFIFVLAAFNLVASLTMLFVEKLANLQTMKSFGATKQFIFKIFFYEGLLISGKGILIGLLLGYGVCFVQQYFEILVMPNSGGESFPIDFSLWDGILIFSLVSLLSVMFSYFPVKFLIRKNFRD